ncbi:hypothetical protein KSP35_01530 [Aquihabitans sp. G128]|uniref:globin domain-containing protein n=1 Tax=Aquihabitans sp. G128 TaxID=2849779 RepID=UPI001C224AE9|nr:globin domain-containing protein [Aquihabitans sp. G128]QXC61558.1 hypothetical protein KSP35_01530 [Aquihabitans sp. G128]
MTPEELVVVGATWADLSPRAAALGEAFYRHLFRLHPEVRELFPDDLGDQQDKFTAELEVLVSVLGDFGTFLDRTADLGGSHAAYGVRAAHYRASRDALLAALSEVGGPELARGHPSGALEAWAGVHDLVAERMMTARAPSG